MWIFTRYGYYSVVQHKADPSLLLVRARVEKDIKQVAAILQGLGHPSPNILKTEASDYLWRIIIPRSEWESVIQHLAADIDYTNFKQAAHDDASRDAAYTAIWFRLSQWQEQNKRSNGRKRRNNSRGRWYNDSFVTEDDLP